MDEDLARLAAEVPRCGFPTALASAVQAPSMEHNRVAGGMASSLPVGIARRAEPLAGKKQKSSKCLRPVISKSKQQVRCGRNIPVLYGYCLDRCWHCHDEKGRDFIAKMKKAEDDAWAKARRSRGMPMCIGKNKRGGLCRCHPRKGTNRCRHHELARTDIVSSYPAAVPDCR